MREINAEAISRAVAAAVIKANTKLPEDVRAALETARINENLPSAVHFLDIILENEILLV